MDTHEPLWPTHAIFALLKQKDCAEARRQYLCGMLIAIFRVWLRTRGMRRQSVPD